MATGCCATTVNWWSLTLRTYFSLHETGLFQLWGCNVYIILSINAIHAVLVTALLESIGQYIVNVRILIFSNMVATC